jgi:predicted CopG family antitoxin
MPTVYRRNIVMGPKTWEKLRALGKEEERSISDLIREAVLELLKRRASGISAGEQYDPITDNFGKRHI